MSWMDKYVRMIDEQTMHKILNNPHFDQKCELLHAGDCNIKAFIQLFMGIKSVFKIYLLAHVIPRLFKFRKLKKNPRKQLWNFVVGLANSLLFAGFSTAIIRRTICWLTKYSSYNFTIARYPGIISGVAILFESASRQTQISLYCVGKSWETAYGMLKRRQYPIVVPCGNLWLNGIALGVIGYVFLNDPQVFREAYRNLLGLIFRDI